LPFFIVLFYCFIKLIFEFWAASRMNDMIFHKNLREIAFRLTMISTNECDSGTNYLR
jgi:hypothetical protein